MTKKMSEKNGLLEVVFILDRSGSMGGKEKDTIGGFNSMLKKQQETSDNIVWSTVLFDKVSQVIHDRVPVRKVSPLTEEDYIVGGCTALLDAVGRSIRHIARCHKYAKAGDAPGKTLFVITTDGYENASREYSASRVKRIIEEEQEKYGWEFIFLGANIDAVREGSRLGIRAKRSVDYLNDDQGIRKSYEAIGDVMCSMSLSRDEDIDFLDKRLEELREDHRNRSEKGRSSEGRRRRRPYRSLKDYLED